MCLALYNPISNSTCLILVLTLALAQTLTLALAQTLTLTLALVLTLALLQGGELDDADAEHLEDLLELGVDELADASTLPDAQIPIPCA